jgi:hypothetical protein
MVALIDPNSSHLAFLHDNHSKTNQPAGEGSRAIEAFNPILSGKTIRSINAGKEPSLRHHLTSR